MKKLIFLVIFLLSFLVYSEDSGLDYGDDKESLEPIGLIDVFNNSIMPSTVFGKISDYFKDNKAQSIKQMKAAVSDINASSAVLYYANAGAASFLEGSFGLASLVTNPKAWGKIAGATTDLAMESVPYILTHDPFEMAGDAYGLADGAGEWLSESFNNEMKENYGVNIVGNLVGLKFSGKVAALRKELRYTDDIFNQTKNLAKGYKVKGLDIKLDSSENIAKFFEVNKDIPALSKHVIAKHGLHHNSKQLEALAKFAQKNPRFIEQTNGSFLFHGARNNSLLSLITKNSDLEGLIPTGELLKRGYAPLSGELRMGATSKGVNQSAISTVHAIDLETAISYATDISARGGRVVKSKARLVKELEKEIVEAQDELAGLLKEKVVSKQYLHDLLIDTTSSEVKILKGRKQLLESLTSEELKLLGQDFPIIYGLSPSGLKINPAAMHPFDYKEVLINGGATASEIRSVIVPKNKVKYVRQLLDKAGQHDIIVISLESIN